MLFRSALVGPGVPVLPRTRLRTQRVGGLLARALLAPEEPLRVYADLAAHPFCIFVADTPPDQLAVGANE